MGTHGTSGIRNIALAGQGGSGKTTLVEALLHRAGCTTMLGTVEKGNTVSDFDPLEKEAQHSLYSSLLSFDDGDVHINLFDTPGFPDFIGEAIAVLPAVETMAMVVNAQNGIESVTQRLMARAGDRRLCRMIIVNKIDAENVDLGALLTELQEAFGRECLPLNLPADSGSRVVDCFFNPTGTSDLMSVAEAHEAIVDQVVELDEALMERYLEQGQELAPDQLHDPFERALREGHLIPVCFVSARTGAGLPELINVFEHLLPDPTEGNPEPFLKGEGDRGEPFHAVPDPHKHVIAHVFKVLIDPFVGKLAQFRIHQGTIRKDSQLYVGDARKPFRVAHLYRIHGKEHSETDIAVPGDICAVAKVEEIHRNAVLHDSHDEDHLHLKPLDFPTPLHGLAIRAQSRGDEQRLSDALHKLLEEDPCLALEHDGTTGETILRGLSDLHLRTVLARMLQRYRIEVETRPPKIAYRETISAPAEGHYRHKKQTGGAGQFGEVFVRVEPLERGIGFQFESKVVGGAIPTSLIPAVEKGAREATQSGTVAGFPLQDVRVEVYDGKHHPVDSKEIAFVIAGREATLNAVRKARPIVLEPIVNLEITAPADNVGAISGDLSSRRARISGTDARSGGRMAILCQVPLAEIEGYESQLKSMTAGMGGYNLEFSHYEPVPPDIQQRLQAMSRPEAASG